MPVKTTRVEPAREKPKRKGSALEARLAQQLRFSELPAPDPEHKFHPTRLWRFDFAWPDRKIAAEIEGGTWTSGAHSRGKHFEGDCEKYNQATLLGWRVLRFTTDMVKDGRALATLKEILQDER